MVLSFHFCYNFGTCQQTRCVASLGSVHLHNCDIFYLSWQLEGKLMSLVQVQYLPLEGTHLL